MDKAERVQFISDQRASGKTLAYIGGILGITRERVRQIAADFDIPKPEYCERKRKEKPVREKKKRGFPMRVYAEIRKAVIQRGLPDPYRRFKMHIHCAKTRGIPFSLSFEQWWEIWEPNYHLRGNTKGSMVMARYLDSGGYAPGNVHIKTVLENAQERSLVHKLTHSKWKKKHRKASFVDMYTVNNGDCCQDEVNDITETMV